VKLKQNLERIKELAKRQFEEKHSNYKYQPVEHAQYFQRITIMPIFL
jgi:hypothetical protein